MPATRPDEISNGVSLSDKLRRLDRTGVAEQGALDAALGRLGVILVFSPDPNSVACIGSQDDVCAGADKLGEPLSNWPLPAAVMLEVQTEAGLVAVLCDVPVGHNGNRSKNVGGNCTRPDCQAAAGSKGAYWDTLRSGCAMARTARMKASSPWVAAMAT